MKRVGLRKGASRTAVWPSNAGFASLIRKKQIYWLRSAWSCRNNTMPRCRPWRTYHGSMMESSRKKLKFAKDYKKQSNACTSKKKSYFVRGSRWRIEWSPTRRTSCDLLKISNTTKSKNPCYFASKAISQYSARNANNWSTKMISIRSNWSHRQTGSMGTLSSNGIRVAPSRPPTLAKKVNSRITFTTTARTTQFRLIFQNTVMITLESS